MKLEQIINDNDFENARLMIYVILFISYMYLAYFIDFECIGCPLCGMTRAVKSLIVLNFESAFKFNKNVWIFCFIIPIIMTDIIYISYRKLIKIKKKM